MRSLDRFRGCLVGGAAGDALGYAVEFKKEEEIFGTYGPAGITRYANGRGLISDDTQLTMFTAAGLLLGTPEYSSVIFEGYPYFLAEAYRDWYRTQTEEYPLQHPAVKLSEIPDLFSRRAPGSTCLSALETYASGGGYGSNKNRVNHSKGCGGVMRVAPIGLYFCDSPFSIEESDRLGAQAAAVTHGHSLGFLPAAVQCHIIRKLVEKGDTVRGAAKEALDVLGEIYPSIFHLPHLKRRMEKAFSLASDPGVEDLAAIRQLGEGFVGDEALAIAVYCAIRHEDDFGAAVTAAVNHGGDSDSTGSICGSIMGAHLGYEAIPSYFKSNLELHDTLLSLADALCRDEHMVYWSHHAEIDPEAGLFAMVRRDFPEGQTYADYRRDVKKFIAHGNPDLSPEKIADMLEKAAGTVREAFDEKIPAAVTADGIASAE